MGPTGENCVYPARERWFWAGVGFVSALAILLLGLTFATFLAAREAPKPLARQAAFPASPRQVTLPAALSPPPSVSSSPRALSVAPPKRGGTEAKSVSKAKTSERKEPTTPVRIVERVSRSRETGPVPKTPAPPSATPSKLTSRPVPARAGQPEAVPNHPPVSEHVGAAREEWVDLSPRDRVGAGNDRGREERPSDAEDERGGKARGTAAPRLVAGRDAEYPISAMADGVTGSVQLKIMVDPEGFVERAIVVRSSRDARLDTAAIRAALGWRYRPAQRGGRAVAGVDTATFDFFREDRRDRD